MKIDSDNPNSVNGVALTLEKDSGCQVSISTITDASSVTKRLRKAMRLAIEPLRENRMPIRFGLGRTIMGKALSRDASQRLKPRGRARFCPIAMADRLI